MAATSPGAAAADDRNLPCEHPPPQHLCHTLAGDTEGAIESEFEVGSAASIHPPVLQSSQETPLEAGEPAARGASNVATEPTDAHVDAEPAATGAEGSNKGSYSVHPKDIPAEVADPSGPKPKTQNTPDRCVLS